MTVSGTQKGELLKRGRFILLDALRGVAAFWVMFGHVSVGGPGNHPLGTPCSHLAVDFFFLLSGFVLQPTLPKDTAAAGPYLLKRVIRLWPAYLAGFLFNTVGLMAFGSPATKHDLIYGFLPGLLMLPSLGTTLSYPALPPAWSLFAEFWVANLLFILFNRWISRAVLVVIIGVSGAALAFLAFRNSGLNMGAAVWECVPRVMFSFSFGVLLRRQLPSGLATAPQLYAIPITAAFMALLSLPAPLASWPVQLLIVVFAFPMLLLAGSRVRLDGRVSATAELIGAASYPLYVLHFGLGKIFSALYDRHLWPFPHPTLFAGAAIAVMAALFAIWVDEPVRRWVTNRLAFRRPTTEVALQV